MLYCRFCYIWRLWASSLAGSLGFMVLHLLRPSKPNGTAGKTRKFKWWMKITRTWARVVVSLATMLFRLWRLFHARNNTCHKFVLAWKESKSCMQTGTFSQHLGWVFIGPCHPSAHGPPVDELRKNALHWNEKTLRNRARHTHTHPGARVDLLKQHLQNA